MTPRQRLALAYELAFHPARSNAAWNDWDRDVVDQPSDLKEAVEWALILHQRLPEAPSVNGRALHRLAHYQATARLYRMPTMLRRFRRVLGLCAPVPEEVPAWMVRDITLPPFARPRASRCESETEGGVSEI